MVGGAWSTDKQKLKTLASMAAGDTTVGSRPTAEALESKPPVMLTA